MNPKHPLSTITVYRLVASFILAISIYSCANMSRPGGGPRDETPPVFIKSMPVPNALNVSKQKVEIEFDEIIQVDKPSEKVIPTCSLSHKVKSKSGPGNNIRKFIR